MLENVVIAVVLNHDATVFPEERNEITAADPRVVNVRAPQLAGSQSRVGPVFSKLHDAGKNRLLHLRGLLGELLLKRFRNPNRSEAQSQSSSSTLRSQRATSLGSLESKS